MSDKKKSSMLHLMQPTAAPSQKFVPLPLTHTDSDISNFSFKHWHKRMQLDHDLKFGDSLRLWKWCKTGCRPCRWFDSIDYEKKICKCCLKFKTFKAFTTTLLIAVFFYIFMYAIFQDEILPGGTIFFIFLLCFIAYILGYVLMYVGLPPMFGHFIVGLIFGNLPKNWLPLHNTDTVYKVAKILERVLLLIALIRAGLLLDLSRIKNHIKFILRVSFFPLFTEFLLILVVSHFLLSLPWNWSALQGSALCIVSLASITSIMEINRQMGYGEDKHLSTVLIAASACCVVFGMFLFLSCLLFVFPSRSYFSKDGEIKIWMTVVNILIQLLLGLTCGIIVGLLVSFFPDKHNDKAAILRISILGVAAFAIGSISHTYDMVAAGLLCCVTMCIIASNMWDELGWHQDTNPVQYFYAMAYYLGQPATLSLAGFTMNFQKSNAEEIGLSIAVIIIGLIIRELICFTTTLGSLYPTTIKEKLFICIAWFSKGTFQALLAFTAENLATEEQQHFDAVTSQNHMIYIRCIKETTILAILLTTPLVYYGLTLLTPVLLTKKDVSCDAPSNSPVSGVKPDNEIISTASTN